MDITGLRRVDRAVISGREELSAISITVPPNAGTLSYFHRVK